jgi:hypothetical protein
VIAGWGVELGDAIDWAAIVVRSEPMRSTLDEVAGVGGVLRRSGLIGRGGIAPPRVNSRGERSTVGWRSLIASARDYGTAIACAFGWAAGDGVGVTVAWADDDIALALRSRSAPTCGGRRPKRRRRSTLLTAYVIAEGRWLEAILNA